MCNTIDLQSLDLLNPKNANQDKTALLQPYAKGNIHPIILGEGIMLCHFDLTAKENLTLNNQFEQPLLMFATFTQGGIAYEHRDFHLKQTFQTNRLYTVLLNRENGQSYYKKDLATRSFNLVISPSFLQQTLDDTHHPLSKLLDTLEQKPLFNILQEAPLSQNARYSIEMLSHLDLREPMNLFYLKSKVYELLHDWLWALHQNTTSQKSLPELERFYMNKVAAYVQEHLLEPLTLEQLSRVAKTNSSKLQRSFKQLFGQSLFTYICQQRLQHAKALLETQEMRVDEVAKAVGYAHQSNFSTAFTKYFGYAPKSVLHHKTFYM
ncbi:helix-turn-helix transcriptional regulator [Sulfurospirillum halorespirans]|uniref:Putative AraC-type transcriptional regulator n=1 Tax=Sulfurospirillum halorespirans DSM 13726 TaxID=1193502 RepID=A0A1D7TMT2_9BACT|nr:AraC family transcriptional regulator [Sulfurospirillum halorespirans]AOO66297.1 putative AraC-type transcriptional regulator [Sulfurospirillum halorespirans DSM 13726]